MDSKNLVRKTKITTPTPQTHTLPRPRLTNAILQNIQHHRLVAIHATAGYGKTTLLIDVAHQSTLPVCWYTVTETDSSLRSFASHLISSIAQKFPDFGQQSIAFIQNNSLFDIETIITIITNEMFDTIRIDHHFIVIVDDLHLAQNPLILKFFNILTQHTTENCHFIIASRKLLNLKNSTKMVALGQMIGLSSTDLKFDSTELQNLYLKKQNYLPQTEIKNLLTITDGWITALILGTTNLEIYFEDQIFNNISIPLQHFLLHTSLMEEFNPDFCQIVLGDGPWWQHLRQLSVLNIFITQIADSYRYHHLFRDFLRQRMKNQFPTKNRQILHRLAQVYENENQLESAYHIWFNRVNNIPETAKFVERVGQTLIDSSRYTILNTWLNNLNPNTLSPQLLRLKGVVKTLTSQATEGLIYLEQAINAGIKKALVDRAMCKRFLGDYNGAINDTQAILESSPQNAEALREFMLNSRRLGHLQTAIDTGHQALDISKALNKQRDIAVILSELGSAYLDMGLYHQALDFINEAETYWLKLYHVAWLATLNNSKGVLHFRLGEYSQSMVAFEAAIKYAEQANYNRVKAFALSGLGDLFFTVQDAKAAQIAYQQSQTLAQENKEHFLMIYTLYSLAKVARCFNHNINTHQSLLQKIAQLQQLSPYEENLYHLEYAELLISLQEPQKAINLLQTLVFTDPLEKLTVNIALFKAYHLLNNTKLAKSTLNNFFILASKLNSPSPLIQISLNIHNLLPYYEKDTQIKNLLNLIDNFQQSLPALRRQLRRQQKNTNIFISPPSLKINALAEHTQITINNDLITNKLWYQNKLARELFFYLLTRDQGASRLELAAEFWTDAPTHTISNRLSVVLNAVRSSITKNIIIFDHVLKRYLINRNIDYEYDVELFNTYITLATKARSTITKIKNYKLSIAIYQRPYLPEIDREWALLERTRLETIYLKALQSLATLYLEQNDSSNVLKYTEMLLTTDNSLESAHRLAMQAYALDNNYPNVIKQFNICKTILTQEIGINPSPETLTLYHQLTTK